MTSEAPHFDMDYAAATLRLFMMTAAFAAFGSAVAWFRWGEATGAGFAIGAAASLVNLWLWHALTLRISGDQSKKSKFGARLFAGRFLALFAFGYVILKLLHVQPLAVILGLLVSALAVLAEATIELALVGRRSPK